MTRMAYWIATDTGPQPVTGWVMECGGEWIGVRCLASAGDDRHGYWVVDHVPTGYALPVGVKVERRRMTRMAAERAAHQLAPRLRWGINASRIASLPIINDVEEHGA